jgi:type IV secretory pathway TraG/TraD family ATPase VirD4
MNTSALIVLAALAGGAWLAWRAYARPLALGLGGTAVLPAMTLVQQTSWPYLGAAAGLTGLVAWHRWARTSATVTRWGARVRRKSGVASSLDIHRHASAHAVRRTAGTVRPSFGQLSRRARRRMPTVETAVLLCRVGAQRVWSSIENVVLVFGGPRMGKSGWLAGRIVDAPGACLVTSTRADLYEITSELRQAKGPVFVFNAVGLGGIDSTITFDPLTGCADPVTASERATDLIAATSHAGGHGAGDRAYWDGQARRVLAALLHAAALGGKTMRDVAGWVADPDKGSSSVLQLLRQSSEPAYAADASQFLATNDRTRTSITSTIMPALGWLTHPAASRAASGEQPFDVEWLLEQRATVYLLGAEETQAAPLVCALTGHIAREARRLAAHRPGGRLDPPLTLALDEAALISPVPLANWTSDMGGRGVCIIAAFQSRAQLIDRYGEAKAATIVTNAASKVLFGGTADRDDLTFWSTLAGDREEPIRTTDMHGRVASRTTRVVPVLAPAQLAGLPAGRVVVFTKGMSAVVGRAQMAWNRPDVRAVLRPNAVSVRARAFAAQAVSTTAGWAAHPIRAVCLAWRQVWGWITARAAAAARFPRRAPKPAPVTPVPAEAWTAEHGARHQAALTASDWISNVDEPGSAN